MIDEAVRIMGDKPWQTVATMIFLITLLVAVTTHFAEYFPPPMILSAQMCSEVSNCARKTNHLLRPPPPCRCSKESTWRALRHVVADKKIKREVKIVRNLTGRPNVGYY